MAATAVQPRLDPDHPRWIWPGGGRPSRMRRDDASSLEAASGGKEGYSGRVEARASERWRQRFVQVVMEAARHGAASAWGRRGMAGVRGDGGDKVPPWVHGGLAELRVVHAGGRPIEEVGRVAETSDTRRAWWWWRLAGCPVAASGRPAWRYVDAGQRKALVQ